MKNLILMGESSTIEFKTENAHNDSIAKYEIKPVHGASVNDLTGVI